MLDIYCALCGQELPHTRYWQAYIEKSAGVSLRVCEDLNGCLGRRGGPPPVPAVETKEPEEPVPAMPSPQISMF